MLPLFLTKPGNLVYFFLEGLPSQGGDLLAGFGGVSVVDSPQRIGGGGVSPGNPWDLSALDPMAAPQPISAQVQILFIQVVLLF
jgi:hypothetical protein